MIELNRPCERIQPEVDEHHFHPFEISFCGHSNSGKTTLITKIIQRLCLNYTIGYIKHDAHSFQMDHEGKDTDKAWKSGANTVFIVDSSHSAEILSGPVDIIRQRSCFLNCDIVLVEGFKKSFIDKIVVIDEDEKILDMVLSGDLKRVVAFVGQKKFIDSLPEGIPYFCRDDSDTIADFVIASFKKKISQTPLYGLVLAGGRSRRMQEDKALLSYHGQPQTEVCYHLLSERCEKVFLSARMNQWEQGRFSHITQLHDKFIDMGPIGGILTAMQTYPKAAWLVVACDLPYLDQMTLQTLVGARNPFKMATAFKSMEDEMPEPLCSIYEPKSYSRLLQGLGVGLRCPRKILINSAIQLITLTQNTLVNVNDQKHRAKVMKQISEVRP